MLQMSLILTPAYGRDYSSKQEVEDAWNKDKDFIIRNPSIKGKYVNKSNAEDLNIAEVIIRYNSNQDLHSIKVMTPKEDKSNIKPSKFEQTPIPCALRLSIRNTCEHFDDSDRTFVLNEEELSILSFFEENVDTLPADPFYRIFSLKRGEVITFGGGAQTISTLQRID